MKTITIAREQTNITALDEALSLALSADYLGLSVHAGQVRVHLEDSTPFEHIQQAEQIVRDHDPAKLTVTQQAEITQRQNLLQARTDNQSPLDITAYDTSDSLVQQLAYKLHWLEQEIRDLRDL